MKYSIIRPHLAILAANILFGLNYSYSKQLLPNYLSPSSLSLLRVLFAGVMFTVILAVTKKFAVEKKDIFKLIVAGMLGVVGNQMLFLKGLSMTTPVDAAIITTTGPILVMVLSAIFYKDKITPIKSFGMILGFVGALFVIIMGGEASLLGDGFKGNVLVFMSSLSYSCYLVWAKPLFAKYEPATVMGWIFSTGAVFMTIFLAGNISSIDFSSFDSSSVFAFCFVLIGATVLAYLFVGIGLKKMKPTTVGIYSYLQPIVASVYACMMGLDKMTSVKVIAAVMVFSGVFMVSQSHLFSRKK